MFIRGMDDKIQSVGFLSTRFQGTDGVSLETEKWIHVFERMGFECFFWAGLSDWDPARTMVEPLAFFDNPEVEAVQAECFGKLQRSDAVSAEIHRIRKVLKESLYEFVERFDIHVLVVENALAIPMNIPLGLAITELVAETGIPSIGHHHDFYWERTRFLVSSVPDYILNAFPPKLNSMVHAVINTAAGEALSYRKGLSSVVIPNVFDYSTPTPGIDDYNADFRQAIGIAPDDILVLQPTRIVARKGIEHAIELINRMNNPKVKLLISHQAKDEGRAYYERIVDYAARLNVEMIIVPHLISSSRGTTADGQKIYSLWDIYPHADFITYPSTYEGFGNAFLEAVYFKKPLLVNRYSIFVQDIEPLGFDAIVMDTYVTDREVKLVEAILADKDRREEMVQKNYDLAARFFSYDVLEQQIKTLLLNFGISDTNNGCS